MAQILVIDDDLEVRRVIRRMLERAGHGVTEARDGAEGVLLYRSAPSDLVITDVFMPGQDGIETIQQLRDEYPACRILAISGGAAHVAPSGLLSDAQVFGADAVLAKPFDQSSLISTVGDLLARA